MSQITSIRARQILDSRGNPTVEAEVRLENGGSGRAAAPSGASVGKFEVRELRDGDKSRYHGKSVTKAVEQIHSLIAPSLIGMEGEEQVEADKAMLEQGRSLEQPLGGNGTLAVSLALAKAAADGLEMPLYRYLGGLGGKVLPRPMVNVINGGAHASNRLAIQEFMLYPRGESFSEALRMAVEVFHTLRKLLAEEGLSTAVGDEGGVATEFEDSGQALQFLCKAIAKSGYKAGEQIELALDVAASELFDNGKYRLEDGKPLGFEELAEFYRSLVAQYPIVSIEDPFAEEDHAAWSRFTAEVGQKIQIVGDDILVTSPELIKKGAKEKWANCALIKPNQIGTLSQTLDAVCEARRAGWGVILSHRSGDTEDDTISDIAVAVSAGQIKTGAPMRSERTAKYNRLLRIEEELGKSAVFNPT